MMSVCHTSLMPDGDLVQRWWEEHRLSKGGRADRLRKGTDAWSEVYDRLDGTVDEVVRLLVELAECAASADEAVVVGAGPLEGLIANRARRFETSEGQALLEALDTAARRNARFRIALNAIDIGDDVPVSVRRRLQRFR